VQPPAAPGRQFAPSERPAETPRAGAKPPWVDRLRNIPPQERERVLENQDKFRSLPSDRQEHIRRDFQRWDRLTPLQRDELRDRERVWRQMTPEQREHIRADVLPRWEQMPSERRQAIQRRLRVLREMPESARNQHLGDPNFTRGMSREDQALLRDLSHLHVGGAPELPAEH